MLNNPLNSRKTQEL